MERVTAKTGELLHCAPFWCLKRSTVKRMRRQAIDISDKGLLPKIYKELLKPNSKGMNHLIKKQAKDLNKHLTKEDIEMANKHGKRCSTS